MNERTLLFIAEYVKDGNGTAAAKRAGYSERSAHDAACRLLKKPEVAAEIRRRHDDIAAIAGITKAAVLRRYWELANADPNELMQVRRDCCRHCWGLGFNYQWRAHEYAAECEKAVILKIDPPGFQGGFGFDENAEPNPDCPACSGNGNARVHVHDTRKLKGAAKSLYAGVQQTKDGIKVLTRNQDAALDAVRKFLGMDIERKELSGPDGAPIAHVNLTAEDLTDEQLLEIINAKDDESPDGADE